MRLTDFWATPDWHAYERACGDEPGTRSRLLAAADWRTRVVDLHQDRDALWRDVRRSYHAVINGLARSFTEWTPDGVGHVRQRNVIDGPGAGWVTRTCELLHIADAGRQTRSDATWQLMGDWAEQKNGLFVVAFDGSDPGVEALADHAIVVDGQRLEMGRPLPIVGYVYFIVRGAWAYYFSAASLRGDINIALVWWAMMALRDHGTRWCELGWQGQTETQKGRQIEFFRRGFGGVDLALDAELEE